MTTRPIRDNDLFKEVESLLSNKIEHEIPNKRGFRGTGGPGRLLEELLHVQENNQDLPDAGRWEIKFSSNSAYLTLFHKDPQPPKILKMISAFGWRDKNNHISFRHTIWGKSKLGFEVSVEDERLIIKHNENKSITPFWTTDDILNSASSKLRNLIVVEGTRRNDSNGRRFVTFESATTYSKFKITKFLDAVKKGNVAVDFDARTKNGSQNGIRNHGTKFRVKMRCLGELYTSSKTIGDDS